MTVLTERSHPLPGQILRFCEFEGYQLTLVISKPEKACGLGDANIVTSEVADSGCYGGLHRPVLDIDFPCKLIPSSTPGHFHLYMDRELSWHQYKKLLTVLAEVGLIESGYLRASLERCYTAVRLPWISK